MEENYDQEIDLLELVKLLLNRWYLILGSVFVLTLGTTLYAYMFLEDTYIAETSMVVLVNQEDQSDAANFQFGQRLIDTYTELAQSRMVVDGIIEQLQLPYSNQQVKDMMSVSAVRDTIVIKLNVEHTDPVEAYNIANAAGNRMQRISEDLAGFDNIEILDKAVIPENPSGPNRLLYIAIGVVLGGMIGVGGVFLIEFLDNSIKTTKDIEQKLKLRVLGVIPDYQTEDGERVK